MNNTESITVWLGLKLSQLIEVNLKNQVMTTNLWVMQKWFDYKLRWEPEEYGGVTEVIKMFNDIIITLNLNVNLIALRSLGTNLVA